MKTVAIAVVVLSMFVVPTAYAQSSLDEEIAAKEAEIARITEWVEVESYFEEEDLIDRIEILEEELSGLEPGAYYVVVETTLRQLRKEYDEIEAGRTWSRLSIYELRRSLEQLRKERDDK